MLSESTEGWVLYDDEGRIALLRGDLNTVLLDAAKVSVKAAIPCTAAGPQCPTPKCRHCGYPEVGARAITRAEDSRHHAPVI